MHVHGGSIIISALDNGGNPTEISQGFGLGIREHNDVMLAYGLSRKTTKRFSLPANQFAVVTLTVPPGITHHAEGRFISADGDGPVDLKLILDKTAVDISGTPTSMAAFNEKGPVLDPSPSSVFEFYGASVGNPVGGTIDESNTMDDVSLYSDTGGFFAGDTTDTFKDVVGRHYGQDSEGNLTGGFYALLFENTTAGAVELVYSYSWHEY